MVVGSVSIAMVLAKVLTMKMVGMLATFSAISHSRFAFNHKLSA